MNRNTEILLILQYPSNILLNDKNYKVKREEGIGKHAITLTSNVETIFLKQRYRRTFSLFLFCLPVSIIILSEVTLSSVSIR